MLQKAMNQNWDGKPAQSFPSMMLPMGMGYDMQHLQRKPGQGP